MRAGHGADDVEGVANVGHPIAHGLVEGILQRLRAGLHRHHAGAEQLHAIDVGGLALDVLAAHIDHALHAVAGRHRGGGDAVLPRTGFGDDARLAHAACQHRLADAIVHLVRTGVIQILALEVDLRPAEQLRPTFGVVDGAGTADVVLQLVFEFGLEGGIGLGGGIGRAQLVERLDQRLGDEGAAVGTEMAVRVRQVIG